MAASLFIGGIALGALVYAVLYLVIQKGPFFDFMCRRGYYQHVSTVLFCYGLLLVAYRWTAFRREVGSLKLAIPNERISPPDAALWADRIPSAFRDTLLGRRIAELLRGYARGEDVGPLVDRLAANDREDLERSASLLSWVRSMPPVLGLLGTLDGLRGGTTAQWFAEIRALFQYSVRLHLDGDYLCPDSLPVHFPLAKAGRHTPRGD
jgi:hypothetical protein